MDEPKRKTPWRLAVVAVVFFALWGVGHWTGAGQYLGVAPLREAMQSAGGLGIVLFLLAFAIGELLHVFGVIFVVAAVLVYGQWLGGLVAYAGALVSISVSFFVIRGLGGQALTEVRWRPAQRMLARLHERPIATIAALRLVLWMLPALNYALAMSGVRFRHYFIGGALGLLLPVAGCALFVEWAYRWLGH